MLSNVDIGWLLHRAGKGRKAGVSTSDLWTAGARAATKAPMRAGLPYVRPGMTVVDLGCAPGGWLQIAVDRVNALGQRSNKPRGRVLAHGRAPRRNSGLWGVSMATN